MECSLWVADQSLPEIVVYVGVLFYKWWRAEQEKDWSLIYSSAGGVWSFITKKELSQKITPDMLHGLPTSQSLPLVMK